MSDAKKFESLLTLVTEVGRLYEDLIYIGGIAVYLHAINQEATKPFAEATADADLYISLANLSDLRSIEELTQNPRLMKQEFQKGGFSFDVYAERQSSLPVPYSEVAANAVAYDEVKVASLEDLLVLKLEAAAARYASAHGQKDAKDVIRILLLANLTSFDAERSVAYLSEAHFRRLALIVNGPEFMSLTLGNAKLAKALKQKAQHVFKVIEAAYEGDNGPASRPASERDGGG